MAVSREAAEKMFDRANAFVDELLEQRNATDSVIHRDVVDLPQYGGLKGVATILKRRNYYVYTQGSEIIITDKEIKVVPTYTKKPSKPV